MSISTGAEKARKENRITFRLEGQLLHQLEEHARSLPGVPMSVIIRDLLLDGLMNKGVVSSPEDRRYRRKINK